MSADYILLYSSVRWTILSLRKMRKFQLISRSPENLQKRCFSWKFPHRKIRWNFRILCIVYSHMGEIIWATKNKKCYEDSVAYHPLTLWEFCKSLLQKTWSISIPLFSQKMLCSSTIFFLQKNVWVLDPYSKSTLFTFCKRLHFNYVNGSTIK